MAFASCIHARHALSALCLPTCARPPPRRSAPSTPLFVASLFSSQCAATEKPIVSFHACLCVRYFASRRVAGALKLLLASF